MTKTKTTVEYAICKKYGKFPGDWWHDLGKVALAAAKKVLKTEYDNDTKVFRLVKITTVTTIEEIKI